MPRILLHKSVPKQKQFDFDFSDSDEAEFEGFVNSDSDDNSVNIQPSISVGNFHIVEYEGSLFPGKVQGVRNCHATIKCMQKALAPKGSTWNWPEKEDIHEYPFSDVKQSIGIPKLLPGGSRNITFEVPELSHHWK